MYPVEALLAILPIIETIRDHESSVEALVESFTCGYCCKSYKASIPSTVLIALW